MLDLVDAAPSPSKAASTKGASELLAIAAIMLVAIFLRPGIVSVGPILPAIRYAFGLSHAAAALLTTIPDFLMGLLALPTPWLARRFGRDRVVIAALRSSTATGASTPLSRRRFFQTRDDRPALRASPAATQRARGGISNLLQSAPATG